MPVHGTKTIEWTPGSIQQAVWGDNPTGSQRTAAINEAVEANGGRISNFGGVKQYLFGSQPVETYEEAELTVLGDGTYQVTLRSTQNGSEVLDEAGLSDDRHDEGTDPYPDESDSDSTSDSGGLNSDESDEELPSRDSALTEPGEGPVGEDYGEQTSRSNSTQDDSGLNGADGSSTSGDESSNNSADTAADGSDGSSAGLTDVPEGAPPEAIEQFEAGAISFSELLNRIDETNESTDSSGGESSNGADETAQSTDDTGGSSGGLNTVPEDAPEEAIEQFEAGAISFNELLTRLPDQSDSQTDGAATGESTTGSTQTPPRALLAAGLGGVALRMLAS